MKKAVYVHMNNPGYEMMKAFEGMDAFKNRIVAFIDVMGIGNRMREAKTPQKLQMFSKLLYIFANQPFAENKIQTVLFSDCMYLITEPQYIKELISLLANSAYTFLTNRISTVTVSDCGQLSSEVEWDCLKLRGGITYGKVLVLDEEAKKKNRLLHSNIVLGPAVVAAYDLENRKAVFPRIIVDEAFVQMLEHNKISCEDCYLIQDNPKDFYYLDFWKYMFKGGRGPSDFLSGCIDYINIELNEAIDASNAKLTGQLLWYIKYLERYMN